MGNVLRRDRGVASRLRTGNADLGRELQSVLRTAGERQAESFTRHLDHDALGITTRAHEFPELMVLAIDHRSQFEDPGNFGAADKERIAAFKTLGLRALHAVARQDRRFWGAARRTLRGFEALSEQADLPHG